MLASLECLVCRGFCCSRSGLLLAWVGVLVGCLRLLRFGWVWLVGCCSFRRCLVCVGGFTYCCFCLGFVLMLVCAGFWSVEFLEFAVWVVCGIGFCGVFVLVNC